MAAFILRTCRTSTVYELRTAFLQLPLRTVSESRTNTEDRGEGPRARGRRASYRGVDAILRAKRREAATLLTDVPYVQKTTVTGGRNIAPGFPSGTIQG